MNNDYILVLDNRHKGEYKNQTIRYKIVPAGGLKPEEKKIFDKIKWRAKNYNGTTTKRMDSFDRSLCFIQGERWQVEQSLKNLTDNDTDTKYIPFVPMKKKTREHFGSIVEDVFGAKIEDMFNNGESYVLIMKHHYTGDKNKGYYGNKIKYILKPVDMITSEESAVLNSKKTREAHAYMHGYEVRDVMGADEVEFIFDTEEELKDEIKTIKSLDSDISPEIPMKVKTKEHFGDIMESTKVMGNDYVLVVRNNYNNIKRWSDEGYKRRITIKPVEDMTHNELEAFKSEKTTRVPGFDNGYEAFEVLGVDEVEFIFDTKEELEKIVKEWKSWGCDIEENIPMKPRTRKYFGDIIEKVSFITVVSSLLEKYELDEKIIAPAVKIGNKVLRGKKGQMHANLLERVAERIAVLHGVSVEKAYEIMGRMRKNGKMIEGFIDLNGRFATREKAFDIMQYFKSIKNDPMMDRGPGNNRFYSEDL